MRWSENSKAVNPSKNSAS